MKKSIFLFFAAILCATNAWAWCGNSFITVNGTWCTGSNSYVHTGGKFHEKNLGTLNALKLGGELQVWPSSTTAGSLCYKIDDGAEVAISLPKTGNDGQNSKHSGSATVDLSSLSAGNHTIAVWFKHGSDLDNNNGNNFVATFTIAAAAPEPVEDVTVHFINSVEWAAVACHHWVEGGSGTTWPGDVLSKTDEIAGYDVYTATFTGEHVSCIFNNNNKGNQTANLTVEDGKYYEYNTNTWYADKAAAEAALATPIPDETVYLINTGNWSKAMIHTWNGSAGTAWPGVEMTLTGETIEGYAVYSYTAKQGGQANLLFQESENVNKTADLEWQAGKYYAPLKNTWYDTKEAAAADLAAPVEYEYVYLINTNDWAAAHIYTWTPEVAGWPGAAMTKEAEQIAGKDVYSYKVVKGTTFGGLNFNCGSDECKTGDLTWQAGKYYAPSKDKWYDDAAAAESGITTPAVITYALMGVDGDWTTGIQMTFDEENNQYVLTNQDIKATDALKVAKLSDGTPAEWYYAVDTYTACTYTHVDDGFGGQNIVLEDGTYDFYHKLSNNEIYIEKDPVIIDVTLSGMVKTPVSRMGSYRFLSLDDEDENQLSIMNGSEEAYGEFEVSGYLAEYDVTVVGNGTWEIVDGVETLTATLQVKDDNTTIYNVVATVGAATTITLECWDATYTITDPEFNEVTFTGVADGKEFTILVSYFGGEYYSEGEWGETLILGTEVEFADSDPESYYLGGTYIDDASNTYEVLVFASPAAVAPETYTRTVTANNYGTICLPFASDEYAGAEFYEVSSLVVGQGLWLDQVPANATLVAGKPYIFKATAAELVVVSNGTTADAPVAGVGGLTGTFTDIEAGDTDLVGNYIIAENKVWIANASNTLPANRAYINAEDVPTTAQAQIPGRRRVCMGENAATGLDNITNGENTTIKVIENGQLVITIDGVQYNAQGVRF